MLKPKMKKHSNDRPFTRNFQIIILLSRLFGCHPNAISSKIIVGSTKFGKIYSIVLFLIVFFISVTYQIRELLIDRTINGYRQLYTPTNINDIGVLVNYAVCCLVATFRASNFDVAISKIRQFDDAANSPRNIDAAENLIAAALVISTWSLIAWIDGPFDKFITRPHLVAYVLFMDVLSLEIYKFCFVFASLFRHFVKLNNIVLSGKIFIVSNGRFCRRALTVRDVFILRQWLIDSVENFNKYYDVQIVYWFSLLVSSLIMQASVLATGSRKSHLESRDLARFILTFYHLLLLCIIPHFTCKKENFELGLYLHKKPLKITALKMFSVDLPLLLSIVEAFATFTTFILQMSAKEESVSSNAATDG